MLKKNSVNLNEIAFANGINLVVTESNTEFAAALTSRKVEEPKSMGAPGAQSMTQSAAQAAGTSRVDHDPEKIMRDLPVDEFFRVLEQATPEQLQAIIHSFEKGARTKGGGKLLRKVIDVPDGRRTIFSTVFWWECRRPLYNLVVGLAGLPSLLIFSAFGLGQVAIFAALVYAFFANVCYCLGAPAELVARVCWKEKAGNYGPVLLTLGTIFSVILTVCLELLVCTIFILGSICARF